MKKLFERINLFVKIARMSSHEAAAVLGVSPDASEHDISKAYKRLMVKLHPDVNKAPDAADRAVELNIARDTLLNPTGHMRTEGPSPEEVEDVRRDVDDILGRHEREAEEWMADLAKRKEWSAYNMGDITADQLTHPENIENSKERELKRAKYRAQQERAKERRKEKKAK